MSSSKTIFMRPCASTCCLLPRSRSSTQVFDIFKSLKELFSPAVFIEFPASHLSHPRRPAGMTCMIYAVQIYTVYTSLSSALQPGRNLAALANAINQFESGNAAKLRWCEWRVWIFQTFASQQQGTYSNLPNLQPPEKPSRAVLPAKTHPYPMFLWLQNNC